jgi:hypothetical protein
VSRRRWDSASTLCSVGLFATVRGFTDIVLAFELKGAQRR